MKNEINTDFFEFIILIIFMICRYNKFIDYKFVINYEFKLKINQI